MYTKQFWLDSAERAVKTAAQSVLALLGTGMTGVLSVDASQTLYVVAFATLSSLVFSIVSSNIGTKGTPSVIKS